MESWEVERFEVTFLTVDGKAHKYLTEVPPSVMDERVLQVAVAVPDDHRHRQITDSKIWVPLGSIVSPIRVTAWRETVHSVS